MSPESDQSTATGRIRLVEAPDGAAERISERTDLELLAAIADGCEESFGELMARKTEPLLGLTQRIVKDREEARDLVQLTFLRIWEKRRAFDRRWSVNTWIYRIATNLAIDLFRSKKTRREKVEPVRHHYYRVLPGGRASNLEAILQREALEILRDLSTGLSERQRLAFVLRQIEGLSTRDVARILGCRESTVRNHLFAARKTLQVELGKRFPEYASAAREVSK